MSNAEFQKLAQIKWQSDCLNKEKSGEIQWIMKRCPSRIPIDDMWRRFTSVLSYPVSSSSKRKRERKNMFLWLTFFSQKCPLQNVSIQHLMPSTKKLTFQKVPLFKRILFVYLKIWKNQTWGTIHWTYATLHYNWCSVVSEVPYNLLCKSRLLCALQPTF